MDYKQSGVDVEEGYRAVSEYKKHAKKTAIPGVLSDLGSFNGMFSVPKGIKNPVMVLLGLRGLRKVGSPCGG